MDYLVLPRANEIRGAVRVPASKSATNRALVLAALSGEPVELAGPLESDDTRALARCLLAMGARIRETPDGLSVAGPLAASSSSETVLDAGDSGTAARFLAALAAATPGRFLLDGSPRLRERPMAELLAALRSAGAEVREAGAPGCLPLSLRGATLRPATIEVDASRSSQFLSALLLAAVAVEGGLAVRASGEVASAPYVETTLETLAAFGHQARREGGTLRVSRGARPARRYEVPGDDSSAVPLLAAAGAAGGEITVTGLRVPSTAADTRALPVLERMGLRFSSAPDRVTAAASAPLRPVRARASDFPDSVPALAALAALAEGESRFEGIGHLRWKESDRIAALAALLSAAGVSCEARDDALSVTGGLAREPGRGTRLPTSGDHRIAMAAALLSIARGGFLIENPACVSKSYPEFFRDLASVIR